MEEKYKSILSSVIDVAVKLMYICIYVYLCVCRESSFVSTILIVRCRCNHQRMSNEHGAKLNMFVPVFIHTRKYISMR